ncbi:EF-P beta-lysylation protein EpmB [Pseudohongiella nitratireducens]|uniref:L-lysine 2,3-aminomutase n=1 Tax=Pseudohongiella nitratireducens TaxID=1768907 RepID=A0A917GLQ8_9GAMM|nr:EF-P beta-lysylation protein EpmB [Pseudohongiella nitratireducens]MDF1622206.1 EF-P beta-lysylation protein EpmB [Pseudohongiella nitratireducens]GGG50638.1 EF-P beta-lysylation protein EpmB [Pseudohongiella nitratireducens]
MMLVAKETSWQRQLSDLITDPAELLSILNLSPGDYPVPDDILATFPLKVPRAFVSRMRPGDPLDPLLRQVLPIMEEGDDTPGFTIDPLSEADFNPQAGILHKYQGRILVLAAPHCAIHCRYCFRRHFPYDENIPGRAHWEESLKWLADRPDIREVIYSGGDPLAANDRHLAWLTKRISEIPHIRRLRIHTRTPVVIPARVNESLLTWLNDCQLQKVMVVHINHAQEIDAEVAQALQKLRNANVTLLNQSVLLKGINDNVDALEALSESLSAAGVLPYYLHMLDRVQGVAHFNVSDDRAFALMDKLKARLPGFLVPSLVREEPGETSKTRLI